MVFPEAMRFLWKGYPEGVKAGESQNLFLKGILQAREGWVQEKRTGLSKFLISD